MGAVGIGALIATLAFPILLVWGWVTGQLGPKAITAFMVLGVAAYLGLPRVPHGSDFVMSAMALIDVALVFAVFKGDVRIT